MATALRVVAIIFALLFLVGFGVCGVLGVVAGVTDGSFNFEVLALGLVGIAIAVLFGFAIKALISVGKTPKDPS